ncbi:putative colanic acid biosynthesis acetyltransferase (plasmid) [Rhizobium sp. WL3]|uniref:putative colanic acid biosynthesis acetyltransferase n=1 Tax=Rhizobium sp. WL3 TaxID=2603277 RepID=UPI0011C1EAA3|nr:putative colanic acid biosynthesis acetyltransferase [Rhizobium sp. WL3]QEE43372.1 putative colanic acid biosynthesis acetyltransferase [Rhizobium sp. WL3]
MTVPLDARSTNPRTGGASFPLRNRIVRAVWNVTWRSMGIWTPIPLFGWRRFLLRLFGAKIAAEARVYPGVEIWAPANLRMESWSCLARGVKCYSMAMITLDKFALVSQGAHLCAGTHDIDDPDFQLRAAPILIGENAWVAAEAFVGPGVAMGEGAVLGARGVLFKDLQKMEVAVGNPARVVRMRTLRLQTQ